MNQLFGSGLISAVAVFGFCQCSRPPTTAEEVIDRNTKAMGGRAALEAVQALEFELHIADRRLKWTALISPHDLADAH